VKQSLAGVLGGFQSLAYDSSREKPVDRLTALAAIQARKGVDASRTAFLCSLGVDLIAFKFAHRASSKADAEDKLAIALSWKRFKGVGDRERGKIAACAVREWAVDICPSCAGARQVPDKIGIEGAQPMRPCMTCSGTGKRRYDDSERIEALGNSFARAMAEADALIGAAEDLAIKLARRMLDR
jgi:hypothetical protein